MEIKGKKFKLVVEQDECTESPREWDNLGEMICFHRRYDLGDKHRYDEPRDFLEDLASRYVTGIEIVSGNEYFESGILQNFDEWKDEELFKVVKENCTILPLFLYDHSGITMSTSPFSCRWDSGQVGWIYCENKVAEKEKVPLDKVEGMLRAEVEVYDQYLTGEVYEFILYEKKFFNERRVYKDAEGNLTGEFDEKDSFEWVPIDSCCGFYGSDFKTNGIYDHVSNEVLEGVGILKEGKLNA